VNASCLETIGHHLLRIRGIAVYGIYPQHGFRFLDRLDVEIDGNRLPIAAHQHALEHFVTAGVDLLVRHVGRDENEIAGIGFRGELQMLSPTHPRLSLHDVDDAFEVTMMMRAGLGVRLDRHGAGPQFLRANAGEVDGSLSIHPRSRGHIRVKLIAWNDANAIVLPAFRVAVIMRVIGNGVIVSACHLLLSETSEMFFRRNLVGNVAKIAIFDQNQAGTFLRSATCLCEGSTKLENSMGSMTDKIKGATNEAVGKAKQGVGEAADSDRMKGEGAAQELKGKGQKTVGEAKEAVKDVANKTADTANKNL
jgi:uncharacterized protein YjbJ (UPF0337 family)